MKAKFKKIALYSVLAITLILGGLFVYLNFVLPNVDEAPYLEVAITPERVERGKYLANNVAVCMDCHSSRDWERFSGPLKEGSLGMGGEAFGPEMGFPGHFYARNLTPTNLSKWTDGEVFRAITSGVNKEGKALFPVMPYGSYGKLDKEDVYDIIAYLRTLAPMEDKVAESKADFPMSLIVNTIPTNPSFGKKPNPREKEKYGEYLVNAASCIECHTQADKGQLKMELAFSGGREFLTPGGILKSANITPDLETGIGNWDQETFVKRFKAYSNPDSLPKVKHGEYNSIMPWSMYAGMEESDLEAIYVYLRKLKPMKNQVIVYTEVKNIQKK